MLIIRDTPYIQIYRLQREGEKGYTMQTRSIKKLLWLYEYQTNQISKNQLVLQKLRGTFYVSMRRRHYNHKCIGN